MTSRGRACVGSSVCDILTWCSGSCSSSPLSLVEGAPGSGCWPFQPPSLEIGSWHAAGWRLLHDRSQGFSSWRAARMSLSPSSSQSGKLVRREFALASLIPQVGLEEFSSGSSDPDSCSHTLLALHCTEKDAQTGVTAATRRRAHEHFDVHGPYPPSKKPTCAYK